MAEYKNRELVAVLRDLLSLAEEGTAQGIAFIVKVGRGDHRAGVAGDYRRFPEEALSATFKMERFLMKGRPPFEDDEDDDSTFSDSKM